MMSLADNYKEVRTRIEAACRGSGRRVDSVQLIAVSKFHPKNVVEEALGFGQRCFGENRVQEASTKFSDLKQQYPELELHLLGALQTNKAEEAVALFDVVQTLDRPKLAQAIAKAIGKTGRTPRLYVEVNSGNEPQKSGLVVSEVSNFIGYCRDTCGLPISGLMTIPPQKDDPLPHFIELRKLADRLHLPHLSMGMSGDFEKAIGAGATEVRVGTALFGERPVLP